MPQANRKSEIQLPLEREQLNTQAVWETYQPQELPVHVRFGKGQRYQFGTTSVDIYPAPLGMTPVLWVRGRRSSLAIGNVFKVTPTEQGGCISDER